MPESVRAFQVGNVRLVHLYAEPKVSAKTILSRIDLGLEGTQEMSKTVVFGDFNVDRARSGVALVASNRVFVEFAWSTAKCPRHRSHILRAARHEHHRPHLLLQGRCTK